MAYKTVSPDLYPFRRENAKFFSQELIENVLLDFGHVWKPVHSKRESQLRKVSSFVFIPPIGRLVAYVSRKYAGFVVMKCLKNWNYINSHRPSVRQRMICNEIVLICTRSELEIDDLGLFTFMALVVDYARLALTHEQEHLIETIVDALSYCLTSKIPGGFVPTLDRLKRRALSFIYPRNYIVYDYDPKIRFLTRVDTNSVYTPRSEFESPIMFEQSSPLDIHHNTPTEDIVRELKNRKLHREIFRRKMMIDRSTQTEIESKHSVVHLQSVVVNSNIADFVEKIEIQTNLNNPVPVETLILVETTDVSVQTWNSIEIHLVKFETEIDGSMKKENNQKSCSGSRALDLDAVIEKLKIIEKFQVENELPSDSDAIDDNINEPGSNKDEKGTGNLNVLPLQYDGSRELDSDSEKKSMVSDPCKNQESLLQSVEKQCPSTSISDNVNRDDSQFESLDVSTDERTKILDEHSSQMKNYSFDSQIGSLDESVRTSDESRLEN